jgi:hypothetical protein
LAFRPIPYSTTSCCAMARQANLSHRNGMTLGASSS